MRLRALVLGLTALATSACQQLEQALASGLQNLGADHPNVATRRSSLGVVLQDLGDLAGAQKQKGEALRVARLQPRGSYVRNGILRSWGEEDAEAESES